MTRKWVDNTDYYGPDRRERRGARLRNRRRFDETTKPPYLGATLRRLRVLLGHPSQDNAHDRALQLVGAAIGMAERLQMSECEAALRRADQRLRERPDDFDGVEALVAEAMAYT